LSFFDEVDEPPRTEPRTTPRTSTRAAPPRRRSSGGGGRRPPSQQQSVQTRRLVLAVVLVIFVVLVAVGVHSCQVSSDQSALKDYANGTSSLISRSDATGVTLFKELSGAGSSSGLKIQSEIDQTRVVALKVLSNARQTSAPDSVKTANTDLIRALQMRVDGITNIAGQIQAALGGTATTDAISAIAAETGRLYASDVVYKDYAAPELVSALHANGIAVGGTGNGVTINAGQFVPDVNWVQPSFVAQQLNVTLPSSSTGKATPGLHGHSLDSVSVAGTTLQTGSTNTIPSKPAPTFTLNLTNGGTNNETGVKCKVSVTGTGASGLTVIPQTQAGQHATCQVTLKSPPAAGTYTVVATVEKVLGEKNLSNNSLSFPVTFQ
jgi:Domain of unknown function DUF11